MLSSDTGERLFWQGKPAKLSAILVSHIYRTRYSFRNRHLSRDGGQNT
jgi:hypothetical protein